MKLGGLFSGIGGFELAWSRLGGEVAWMCEIDKKARKVLEAQFPGVPIYEDVEQINPDEVEAVDVLTGGSPCQGFSVAGRRTGLEHGESRLFADYVRIMDGLADRGLKYALWENVPGVLSIKNPDGERTFPHVVAALAGADEPVRLDPKRKWNAGLVAHGGRGVAWRILDSRYFGVAQRRRRIFACVAFGDSDASRAGRALLALSQSVSGDSAASEPTWEESPPSIGGSLADPRISATVSSKWHKGTGGPSGSETGNLVSDTPIARAETASHEQPRNVAQAFNWQSGGDARGLNLTDQPSALTTQQTPAVLMTMREGKPGGGKGPPLVEEESLTLATGNGQTLFQPEPWAFSAGNSEHARSMGETQGISPPIRAAASGTNQAPTVGPVAFDEMNFTTSDQHHVLRAGTKQSTGVVEPWSADSTGTLQARNYKGLNHENVRDGQAVVQTYGVRRLTPVECERLQAFPDGWTEPAGSDSARYKALGNAVTVNTVQWILRRMIHAG